MSLTKKIIIGIAIYLVCLIVLFPARMALGLLPLADNIRFDGVSGSIWSGRAEVLEIQQRQIEAVRWKIHPFALLMGRIDADLIAGEHNSAVSAKGFVSLSMSEVKVKGLLFDAPSSFLVGNTYLPFKTKVKGEISLTIPQFTQGSSLCEKLDGKLFVKQLRVNNEFGQYPLGNVELGLSCISGNVNIATDEKMNQLGVQGYALLYANKQIKLKAKIRETNAQPKDLKQALRFLGRKNAQGYYPISYQGHLPI